MPQFIVSWAITYREDWFKEAGFEYPKTWDDFRKVGRALKAKASRSGRRSSQHQRPEQLVLSAGVDVGRHRGRADGRGVVLNSMNTLDAVKFNNVLWKEVFDEGGLAWDDSNNNRAFLSSEISLTGNAPSIYVAARQKFPDVYKGTNHGHYPPGPAGRFYWLPAWNSVVMRYSKNQKVAKDFIRFYMDRARFEPYFETMDTFGIPAPRPSATTRCGRRIRRPPCSRRRWPRPGRSATPALRTQGHRSALEVHHRRHVRQGDPGLEARGRRLVGDRRAEESLRILRRSPGRGNGS